MRRSLAVTAVTATCLLSAPLPAIAAEGQTSSDAIAALENLDKKTSSPVFDVMGSTASLMQPSRDNLTANVGDVVISAAVDAASPTVLSNDNTSIEITLPYSDIADPARIISRGVLANDNNNDSESIRAVKDDGSVQFATVIDGPNAPTTYGYGIQMPQGAQLTTESGGLVSIRDASGDFLGGFAPAWAKDASGRDVPTHYSIDGGVLTQHVDHASAGITYPVVADPLFARGMIKEVKWERWANGGYELRFTVTALARATHASGNNAIVYTEGLKDLREHYPRSMQYATMAQQWDCHVTGLPATINIDLESYRRSWPGWRSGIAASAIKGDPARACNW